MNIWKFVLVCGSILMLMAGHVTFSAHAKAQYSALDQLRAQLRNASPNMSNIRKLFNQAGGKGLDQGDPQLGGLDSDQRAQLRDLFPLPGSEGSEFDLPPVESMPPFSPSQLSLGHHEDPSEMSSLLLSPLLSEGEEEEHFSIGEELGLPQGGPGSSSAQPIVVGELKSSYNYSDLALRYGLPIAFVIATIWFLWYKYGDVANEYIQNFLNSYYHNQPIPEEVKQHMPPIRLDVKKEELSVVVQQPIKDIQDGGVSKSDVSRRGSSKNTQPARRGMRK